MLVVELRVALVGKRLAKGRLLGPEPAPVVERLVGFQNSSETRGVQNVLNFKLLFLYFQLLNLAR